MEKRLLPPIPKEHGAWALLYGPFLVVTVLLASLELRLFFLFVAITALFLAHEPMVRVVSISKHGVRREKKRHWIRWLGIYLAVGVLSAAILIFGHDLWKLVPLGAGVGVLLTIHLYLASKRKERHLLGEVVGVLGLTATAPVTYYVLVGHLDLTALIFWMINLLYFFSGLFFVKMRVSRFTKKEEYPIRVTQCAAYHALLIFSLIGMVKAGWIPILATAAYFPIVIRAFWGIVFPHERLNLRKIGFSELGYTAAFVLLLAVSFLAPLPM